MSPVKKSPRKATKKPAPKKAVAAKPKPPVKGAAKKAPPAKEPAKVAKKSAAPPPIAPGKKAGPAAIAAAPAPKGAPFGKAAAAKAPPAKAPGAKEPRKPGKPRPRAQVLPDLVKPGLGGRWECYSCGSKFYDLERPEPTCPKCGADQRDKPREAKTPSPSPPPERQRRAAVPMGSLLDEDEEPAEDYEADDEDLGAIDDEPFLAETPEVAEDDDDVDVGTIEED